MGMNNKESVNEGPAVGTAELPPRELFPADKAGQLKPATHPNLRLVLGGSQAAARSAPPCSFIGGDGESGELHATPTLAAAVDSPASPIPQGGAAPDDLASCYPEDSLIAHFVTYAEQQIETARIFVLGGALTIVSVLLNRRVFCAWGEKKIFPNLYIACVGPSGAARKSDLLAIVRAIIEETCPGALLADYSSHERLVECFAEEPIRALVYTEGKNFVDMVNSSPTLAGDMLQLYDGASISTEYKSNLRRAKHGGKKDADCNKPRLRIEARETFLSLLLGLPRECWRLSAHNRHNGLLSRFEVLSADQRGRNILHAPPVLANQRQQLIKEARALKHIKGCMSLSSEAESLWLELQQENRRRLDGNPPDLIAAYLSRMPFTMLRIAMLYEAATSGGPEISAQSLTLAARFGELCRGSYLRFLGSTERNDDQRLEERILGVVNRARDRLAYSKLLKKVTRHGQWTATEVRSALQRLAVRGAIHRVDNPATKFPDVAPLTQPGLSHASSPGEIGVPKATVEEQGASGQIEINAPTVPNDSIPNVDPAGTAANKTLPSLTADETFRPRCLFPPETDGQVAKPEGSVPATTASPVTPPAPVSAGPETWEEWAAADAAQFHPDPTSPRWVADPSAPINAEIKSCLLHRRASDAKWKESLQKVDLATLEAVMKELPTTAGKTARRQMESRLRKLQNLELKWRAEVQEDAIRDACDDDLIARLRANGMRINVLMKGTYSVARDYRERLRELATMRGGITTVLTTRKGRGCSLDEIADDYNYDCIDDLIDDLERCASMANKARIRRRRR